MQSPLMPFTRATHPVWAISMDYKHGGHKRLAEVNPQGSCSQARMLSYVSIRAEPER